MPAALDAKRMSGSLPPVIVLVGEEDLLLEETLDLLLEHAVDPATAEFNRDVLHGEDLKGEELFVLAGAYPMMAERRLIAVRGWDRAPASVQEDMARYCAAPSATTCVVLCARSLDKRRKAVKTLLQKAEVHEFKPLDGGRLPRWMSERCAREGRELPAASAAQLAEQLAGAPLRLVAMELDKLLLLVPEGGRIGEAELADALGVDQGADAFALQDAILRRESARALAILTALLRNPEAVYQALATLIRGFGRLWFALQLQARGHGAEGVAGALGLNPYMVKRLLAAARGWTVMDAGTACRELRDLDMGLKGDSPLSERQQLTGRVLRLCRPTTSH